MNSKTLVNENKNEENEKKLTTPNSKQLDLTQYFYKKPNQMSSLPQKDEASDNLVKKKSYSATVGEIMEKAYKLHNFERDSEGKSIKPASHIKSNKSYSKEQKDIAISLTKYLSYAEIQRTFFIEESTLRYWVKHGSHEDRRKENSGRKPIIPDIEAKVYGFFQEQRKIGSLLSLNTLIIVRTINNWKGALGKDDPILFRKIPAK